MSEALARPHDGDGNGAALSGGEPFLHALLGGAVLLLAVRAAEPVFFGDGFYGTLSIHPFWIVILLASVQSGLFAGVATAGLAALMMDWSPRPVGADITDHYLALAMLPVQWILVAVVVGSFRQAQLREEERLRRENARLAAINETIAAEVLRMDEAVARYELAAATGTEVGAGRDAVLDALAALQAADESALADRFRAVAAAGGHRPALLCLLRGPGAIEAIGTSPEALAALDGALSLDPARLERLARHTAGQRVAVDALVAGASGEATVCGVRDPAGRSVGLVVVLDAEADGARGETPSPSLAVLLARGVEAALGAGADRRVLDLAPFLVAGPLGRAAAR